MRPAARRVPLALLLAALAGCAVELEGAACPTPGDRAHCPDGQACGTDLTCSKRAAGCTPCVVDALTCKEGDAAHVYRCTAEGDGACGQRITEADCTADQACHAGGGSAACQCSNFVVDPDGADHGTACHYAGIAKAIAAARALGASVVQVGGPAGQAYGEDAEDKAGIAIPDGITVRAVDAPWAPATRVVTASAGGEGIRLGAGSALRGVTVRRAAGGPAVGIRITGASPAGASSLEAVAVDAAGAGGAFATGVSVEGSGAVAIAATTVHQATVAGLDVSRTDGDQAVSVTGGLLQGNGIGARLQRGALTLDGAGIFGSTGPGLQATPAAGDVAHLAVRSTTVARGGNVGLSIQGLATLELTQVTACGNTGRTQTIGGVTRTVGGAMFLGDLGAAPAVRASRFFGNGGDQVLVGGASATTWSLDAADCGGTGASAPNVLAGYQAPGVGLTAIGSGTSVSAAFVSWASDFPADARDYYRGSSGMVTGTSNSCAAAAPTCPTAP